MGPSEQVEYAVNVNQFTHLDDLDGMIRFVKAAEENGYDKVRFIDHIVGVVVEKHPEMPYTPYTHKSSFIEVFTLMAYLSAMTTKVTLVTGVLGLPQRQTSLVAKQAAQVDILSGGRLLLGAGLGYNPIEFAALGVPMNKRGRIFDEQLDVLRMLWTQEVVSFKGEFHELDFVNVFPLPVQQPIPIWIGAGRTENPVPPDVVLRRIGKKGDGWCPLFRIPDGAETLDAAAREAIDKVNAFAKEAGRPAPALELGLYPDGKDRNQVLDEIAALHALGSDHMHVRFDAKTTQDQIDHLSWFKELIA